MSKIAVATDSNSGITQAEAKKLGFKRCILPGTNLKEVSAVKNIQILAANSINELLNLAF